jgi:hypothetical protein
VLGVFRYLVGIPPILPHGARDVGEAVALVAIVLVGIGVLQLVARARIEAGIVLGPIGFLAIASALGKYPILTRTLLFLAPAVALVLAAGIVAAARAERRPVALLAVAAGAVVVVVSASDAAKHLGTARTRQQIEPVLAYLAAHQRPADGLYVFYKAQYGFRFYLDCSCSPATVRRASRAGIWPARGGRGGPGQWAPALRSEDQRRFIVGRDLGDDASRYARDVSRLRARGRVWVVVSDLANSRRRDILRALDRVAARRASYVGGGHEGAARAYLYVFG